MASHNMCKKTKVNQNLSGKETAIRRKAVRETADSRHHDGQIEGPPSNICTSHHYRIEWFKGVIALGQLYV